LPKLSEKKTNCARLNGVVMVN